MKQNKSTPGRAGSDRGADSKDRTSRPLPGAAHRGGGNLLFTFLFGGAWLGVAALAKFDAIWLYGAIAALAIAGAWAGRRQAVVWRVLVVLALAYPAWRLIDARPRPGTADRTSQGQTGVRGAVPNDDAVVGALVAAEETHLVLTRKLRVLADGLLDLGLPGPAAEAASLFAPAVSVVDLDPAAGTAITNALALENRPWPIEKSAKQVTRVDLWRPLLDGVDFFDYARLSLVDGDHPGVDMWRYEASARFEALARMKTGERRFLHGKVRLGWARAKAADGTAGEWQITAWKTEAMEWNSSPRPLFVESLDTALGPSQDPATLRRSQHYEANVRHYREGMQKLPHPYFAPISVNHKEGLAVADVNGDGFDDIYITVRIGRNMLLMNQGDGTFVEEAALQHLDLPGHTTCSIFADFDNDGDLDVMLGRSLLRTSYLENRGGWFYQHPIPKYMPMAVISMTAADYNNDGLLDVYLCTYRPAAPAGSGGGYAQVAKEPDFDWPDEFFSPEVAQEFRRRLAEHKVKHGVTVLDQIGPPNVLLVNRGGGLFEPAPENSTVGLWRNSLQATWCDYNDDGRPDLYIPNDWGMNVLFRNDGPAGFTDVTAEVGLTWYGFSMGASFGDYDNDGRDDLYVSNMYSEAGRRITARIPGLNPEFAQSAAGNFLYHREADGKFKQVAGLEPPSMLVKRIGWSWGGCFADFDNDTFLDLYVMSGYYTAPKELASDLDLESNLWRTMVRADENLARPTFRFSAEWKRTPPPDSLGPQIDARMAGVERQGDKIVVHSLHGGERNRCFSNRAGRAFVDISGLTGLDNEADSRGFALIDYDRDGWTDLALVNANQPLFNLYHNEMPAAGIRGGMIAIRFVGGNRTAAPSKEFACRDGFGARVTVDLGRTKVVREHRCGEGWSTQHSATMKVGIGDHTTAASVSVRWPSGKTITTQAVPEGTLLTAYENPADSPSGQAFNSAPYRVKLPATSARTRPKPTFAVRALDPNAKPARLRAYTTFATSSPTSARDLPLLRRLKETLGPEGVDIAAVPVDQADDDTRLAAYAKEWKPTSRLVNLAAGRRVEALAAYRKALGYDPPLPSTVITDEAGQILLAQPGLPTLSALRRFLPSSP